MKKINAYIENFDAPSAGYPYGRLRDDPGDGTGSEAVVATINDLISAIYAVVEAHKTGGVSDTAETTVASDLLDAIDALDDTNVKLSGAQTVADIKTFSSIPVLPAENPTTDNQASRRKYVADLDAANVKLTGTQTVAGNKTFSGTNTHSGSADFSGQVRPRTNPVTVSQSLAAYDGAVKQYTPIRGWYQGGIVGTALYGPQFKGHGGFGNEGESGGAGGPYDGSTAKITNWSGNSIQFTGMRF